ncbi:MAG: general secretion pathway protein GspK [Candidatus Omnitrophica bacterium]|nr:general secretion pathway protein GspK [Candidatus Omnitrophota bacterium]
MKIERGKVLRVVLWILTSLAILNIIFSLRVSDNVKLAKHGSGNMEAVYLARAGVMKMLAELARDTNSYDSLNEDWNRNEDNPKEFKLGRRTVFYGASDETGRLNLNSAGLNEGHLLGLGLDAKIAEKILGYKNKKGNTGFEFIEELFLVDGMERDNYLKIKDFVTIHRETDREVNINTVSEKVLRSILEDYSLVQDILEYRKGPDGAEGTEDDGIFRTTSDISMIGGLDSSGFTVQSRVFRIWAKSFFSEDKEKLKTVEAVIDRSGNIYNWKEY